MIFPQFLDPYGVAQRRGGLPTYLWYLGQLVVERGAEAIIVQSAHAPFDKSWNGLRVVGVAPSWRFARRHLRLDLYDMALSLIDKTRDVIIFGADHASVATGYSRSVSIQHGISWDLPGSYLRDHFLGRLPFVPDWLCKRYTAWRCLRYFDNCPNRVCVDYNFLNWYRTQITGKPKGNIWVIPNFVDLPKGYCAPLGRHRNAETVRIIFARRFVEIRGTRLMIEAIHRLLGTGRRFEVCFAGMGPDAEIIKHAFQNEKCATFQEYAVGNSIAVHEKFHVAVVPSLASEGTSLSLAEAMAAGCAVAASSVGGMTNMIIHNYNGLLFEPGEDGLFGALCELVDNEDKRLALAARAAETAREAFTHDRWSCQWREVLDRIQAM